MKSKTALVLLVVLVACVAFLVIRKSNVLGPAKPPEKSSVSSAVFVQTPMGIVRIAVTRGGAWKEPQNLVLTKQGQEWRIEEPLHSRADAYKVNSLLDAFKDLKSSRSFAPGDPDAVDPNITSLNQPLWTVELADAKGGAWKLAVGKPLPLRPQETYVRPTQQPGAEGAASQQKTYVALADLAETLQRPAREYRDRTVVRFNAGQAVELSLAGGEVREAYELRKHKDEWGIVKPFSARANQEAVGEILGALSYLSVESFVSDAPASLAGYGLEEGSERLVVRVAVQTEPNGPPPPAATSSSLPATSPAPASMPAPKVYAIAFGERANDKVFAKIVGEPAVFQMSASVLDNLLKKMEGLRQNTVLDFDPLTVSAIDLNLPDANVSLVKEEGQWKMVKPIAGKAGNAAVAELLGKLASLKAQSWTSPQAVPVSATGLENPTATITLALAGKGETISLVIGSSISAGTYVKSASGTSIATTKTSDIEPLLETGAKYWDPEIYRPSAGTEPTRFVIARRDDTFTLARGDGNWRLTKPIDAPAEATQVKKIDRALSNVTAEKIVYVGSEVPEKYAKAAYNLTVEVHGRKPTTQPASAPASGPSSAPASGPASSPSTSASQPETATSRPQTQPATGPAMEPGELLAKLQVAKVGLKAYIWRPGETTLAIGEFPAFFYDDLAAELREKTIWKMEPNDVLAVKLVAGGDRLDLRREGDEWVNATNPDEKADAEQVRTYLAGLKDLIAERFMTYKTNDEDAKKLGLSLPWAKLELRLAGGKTLSLTVSERGQEATANRYAASASAEGIFVLPADIVGRLTRKFSDLQKAPPQPEGRGRMGLGG